MAVLAVLVVMTLTPPWAFNLTCEMNSLFWLWMVLLSGFGTFYIALYSKISLWARAFLVWAFALSFLSKAPYISFTMYWSLIAGGIFYVLATSVENREPFYKSAQTVLFLIAFLLVMQLFGRDTLLNFNMKTPVILGTIGNRMIFGSFVMCLAPFVLKVSLLNFGLLWVMALASQSSGPVISVLAGSVFYLCHRYKKLRLPVIVASVAVAGILAIAGREFQTFASFGRGPVWQRTLELAVKNPVGYGGSTYKLLFPLYSQDIAPSRAAGEWEFDNTRGKGLAWRRAHNLIAQILFEYGFVGVILIAGFFVTTILKVKNIAFLSGIIMVGVNSLTAFPERSTNTVLLLLTMLAFCNERKRYELHSLWQ